MAFDYTKSAETANRLLARFGQTISVERSSLFTYNDTTGKAVNTSPADQEWTGVLLDYDYRTSGISNAPDAMIKVGDKQLLLSPYDTDGDEITPVIGDSLTVSGTVYRLNRIKSVAPAGTVVLYDCNLRGA